MKSRSAKRVAGLPMPADFPDLIQPAEPESLVEYYQPTPKPFMFLHSSHLPPATVTFAHSHPCVAVHGCLQGPIALVTSKQELDFDAGAFYFLPAGLRHHWRNPARHTVANFSVLVDHRHPGTWPAASGVKEMCTELHRLVRAPHRFNVAGDPELKQTYWQVADYLMADRPRQRSALTGLLLALVGRALDLLQAEDRSDQAPFDKADEMRRFLLSRVTDRVSIEEVARAARLSPTRAKQIFSQTYGCGILAYFNQLKLHQAKRLLSASNLTIDQVSRKLGFSTPSYFSRVFLRYTGESPTDFRLQQQAT
ncbi:MAG: helix-turn-helix domain-containing protein [Gemmataceae bacterium]